MLSSSSSASPSGSSSSSGSTDSASIQKRLDNVVEILLNSKNMEMDMCKFDVDFVQKSLTSYTEEDLAKASDLLALIELHMNQTIEMTCAPHLKQQKKKQQEEKKRKHIESLRSEFYKIIPHKESRGPTEQWLKEERALMSTLLSFVEIQGMAQQRDETFYSNLAFKLEPLDNRSGDFKLIKAYMMNGNLLEQKAELIDIIRVKNEKDWKPLKTVVTKLVWIGLSRAKLIDVFQNGRIDFHDENSEHFQKYGRGLTFNDVSGGALINAQAQDETETLLLLCQIRLGKRLVVSKVDPTIEEKVSEGGYNYVFRYGSHAPEESGDVKHTDGYVMPLGKNKYRVVPGVKKYNVVNEYVLFEQNRINIKYIVAVRVRGPPTPLL